jgi:hypothetical protein
MYGTSEKRGTVYVELYQLTVLGVILRGGSDDWFLVCTVYYDVEMLLFRAGGSSDS